MFLACSRQLYRFLARRTGSKFNQVVLRRLYQSNTNRPPLSLRRIARNLAGSGNAETIAVLVGTVTDDIRLADVPAMKICALRFTESARARILKVNTSQSDATRANTMLPNASHKSRIT